MEEELIKPIAEETEQQATKQEVKRVPLNLVISQYERIKKAAEYAVNRGIIPSHPHGNVTNFLEWCIVVGLKELYAYARKRRGF